MLTSQGLVGFVLVLAQNYHTVYVRGGMVDTLTNSFIDYKKRQYPESFSESRVKYLKSLVNSKPAYYGADCCGIIKSYMFGGFNHPNYEASKDWNTEGMYKNSARKGKIDTIPDIPGIIVYMLGHVGVYIGGGEVVECTWGDYGDGVVITPLDGRGWTHWLMLDTIEYPFDNCDCNCGCPVCNGENKTLDYVVKWGDSFWAIAERFLGDGNRYLEICNLNGLKPNSLIKPGDVIKIPAI